MIYGAGKAYGGRRDENGSRIRESGERYGVRKRRSLLHPAMKRRHHHTYGVPPGLGLRNFGEVVRARCDEGKGEDGTGEVYEAEVYEAEAKLLNSESKHGFPLASLAVRIL